MANILVVDDEEIVTHVIDLVLKGAGHNVVIASSGEEALKAGRSLHDVDLLIVDHGLSPDQGRNIAELILLDHPGMKILHMSGYPGNYLADDSALTPGAGYLQKPFNCRKMLEVTNRMLGMSAQDE